MLRKLIYIISFTFFLCPIDVQGLSVNYSFVLLPLLHIVVGKGKVTKPPGIFILSILLYTVIFIVAYLYQYEFYGEIRRIFSFFIFMSIFSFLFVKLDEDMIEAFKIAVVAISVILSMISIVSLISAELSVTAGTSAKEIVGTQRIGFIYIVGIWLVYFYQSRGIAGGIIKYSIQFIILAGLLLTFSRASVVALLGSTGFFIIAKGLAWLKRPDFRMMYKGFASLVGAGLVVASLYLYFPIAFDFFNTALIASSVVENVQDADTSTSEGSRVVLLKGIFSYVMHNPFTGAGFLGVWILESYEFPFGSAHNQFTDVLFRTGIFGFTLYLYLIYRVARYLYVEEKALFWGLVGILIYSMFHETFKESQGCFVLTFLLGMLARAMGQAKTKMRDRQTDFN